MTNGVSRRLLSLLLFLLVGACADESPIAASGDAPADVVDEVLVRCLADGTTELSAADVVAQSDGVHVRVMSRLDEPASVNGLGVDVEPGSSDWILGLAPGRHGVACWPFSEHTNDEPATTTLVVHDPDGLWTDGELDCEGGDAWSTIVDFIDSPIDEEPTLDEARSAIDGLRPDDELRFAGYPDDPGSVLVVRDDRVVGSFGLGRFREGSRWSVTGGTACADAGLEQR